MTNKKLEDIFMSYLEKIPEDLKLGEEREKLPVYVAVNFLLVNPN